MSVSPSQIIGAKLGGISSGKKNFITNGQSVTNSDATKVVADVKSVVISGDYYQDWLYYDSHLKTGENSHKLGFHWNSYHNTPGNITGTFTPYITGTGSSSGNRTDYYGETKDLNVSGDLKYNPTTVNRSDISSNISITMTFPPYYEGTTVEDGNTFTIKTQDYYNTTSNPSDYEAKKFTGFGLVAYNTPNPVLNIKVSSNDPSIAKPIDSNNNDCSILTYSDTGFSGATKIKIMPNVPRSSLGTIEGTVTVSKEKEGSGTIWGNSYGTGESILVCNNNGGAFNIINADNSHAITYNRQTNINFEFSSETNNVNGISNSALTKSITIYQSGQEVASPNPELSYSWRVSSGREYINDPVQSGNSYTVSFKYNGGKPATIYNKNNNPIQFKNLSDYMNEDGTVGPSSNEGDDDIYLTIENFDYALPTNTNAREASFEGIVTCSNTLEGSQGKLNGSWYELDDGTRQSTLTTPSKTITGVGSSDVKLYQNGIIWPNPGINIKITATPSASNPEHVTNEESRKVAIKLGPDKDNLTEGSTIITANVDNPNPTVVIHTDSFRPNASTNTTNTGSITSYIDNKETDNYKCETTNSSTVEIKLLNNVTFNSSDIASMGEASWDISISEVKPWKSDILGECTPTDYTFKYVKPGNNEIGGAKTPIYPTIEISGDGKNYYSLNKYKTSFNETGKDDKFIVTIAENKSSGTYAKASLDSSYDDGDIKASIVTDRKDTSDQTAKFTIKSNYNGITVNRDELNFTRVGEDFKGKIKFSFIKQTENEKGNVTGTTVDYKTQSDVIIGNAVSDPGTIDFTPKLSKFYVTYTSGKYIKKYEGEAPKPIKGIDNRYTVTGEITDNAIAGTKVLFGNNQENSFTITVPGTKPTNTQLYEWSFKKVDDTNVQCEISGQTNQETCTLAYNSNISTDSTIPTYGISHSQKTNFAWVKGGIYGGTSYRKLGDLTLKYNNKSASCEVWQDKCDPTDVPLTMTFVKHTMNCDFNLDYDSITSQNTNNTTYNSYSDPKGIAKWEKTTLLDIDFELDIKNITYYVDIVPNIPYTFEKNNNYNYVNIELSYFDEDINVTIGIDVSNCTGLTTMKSMGNIYCYLNNTYIDNINVYDSSVTVDNAKINYINNYLYSQYRFDKDNKTPIDSEPYLSDFYYTYTSNNTYYYTFTSKKYQPEITTYMVNASAYSVSGNESSDSTAIKYYICADFIRYRPGFKVSYTKNLCEYSNKNSNDDTSFDLDASNYKVLMYSLVKTNDIQDVTNAISESDITVEWSDNVTQNSTNKFKGSINLDPGKSATVECKLTFNNLYTTTISHNWDKDKGELLTYTFTQQLQRYSVKYKIDNYELQNVTHTAFTFNQNTFNSSECIKSIGNAKISYDNGTSWEELTNYRYVYLFTNSSQSIIFTAGDDGSTPNSKNNKIYICIMVNNINVNSEYAGDVTLYNYGKSYYNS